MTRVCRADVPFNREWRDPRSGRPVVSDEIGLRNLERPVGSFKVVTDNGNMILVNLISDSPDPLGVPPPGQLMHREEVLLVIPSRRDRARGRN